jgi:hypothetical protein
MDARPFLFWASAQATMPVPRWGFAAGFDQDAVRAEPFEAQGFQQAPLLQRLGRLVRSFLFAFCVAGLGERASGFAEGSGALGQAAFFFGYGFGVDEPLAVAGAAGLLLFGAGEAAEAEQAADFGAGRVHHDGGLLGGKPIGEAFRHNQITLAVSIMPFNSTDQILPLFI